MNAAAQDFRLVAGFTMQRDKPVLDRAFRRPKLFDDADLVVRYVTKDIGNAQQDEDSGNYSAPNGWRTKPVPRLKMSI
jgi:hypothetical protein